MKGSKFLCLLVPLVYTNCSTAIYNTGRHSDILRPSVTKEKVVAKLGKPTRVVPAVDGNVLFEEYIVKGPVFDFDTYTRANLSSGMTLGFGEVFNFPHAVWWRLTDYGMKKIQLTYNKENRVKEVWILDHTEAFQTNP